MSDAKSPLTAQQFADQTGVSSSTVQKWLRTGKIQGIKQNGKWMISAEQLSPTLSAGQAESVVDKENAPAAEFARASDYSIEEFSTLTYLTLEGVEKYLKEGRLSGARDTSGNWRVDQRNLNMPAIRHLVRK